VKKQCLTKPPSLVIVLTVVQFCGVDGGSDRHKLRRHIAIYILRGLYTAYEISLESHWKPKSSLSDSQKNNILEPFLFVPMKSHWKPKSVSYDEVRLG
jgi:hypothetical protein